MEAAVLGIIQGLTEFLPISSSGHLVLGGHVLGLTEPHLLFDIVVHVATLVATVLFYRRAVLGMGGELVTVVSRTARGGGMRQALDEHPEARLALLIVLGTIPTGLVGVLFKDELEALFAIPKAAAAMLLVTAGLLVATRFVRRGEVGSVHIGVAQALAIGLVQGFAIIPGISRSGSTIACALLLGIERELAARFSFLLSLPAILGALVLKLGEGGGVHQASPVVLITGFATAAGIGLLALAVLIPLVKQGRLHYFAGYLVVAGGAGLLLL